MENSVISMSTFADIPFADFADVVDQRHSIGGVGICRVTPTYTDIHWQLTIDQNPDVYPFGPLSALKRPSKWIAFVSETVF